MKELELDIAGMTCDHCAVSIEKNLSKLNGIEKADVSYPNGKAMVAFDDSTLDKASVIEAVNQTGKYQVVGESGKEQSGENHYSLIIIGGGSAAFAAAIRTSELGGTALIINKGLPTGGTCVNVGCVPSKTLIRTAEAFHNASHPRFEGIETTATISDFKKVIEQKRQMVRNLRQEKYVNVIKDDPSITLIEGYGKLIQTNQVQVNNSTYTAENILIATGASPFIPEIPGLKEAGYLTNESAYELEDLPEDLVILGGGYIALENAQLFSRLGSKVTVLQRSEHVLSDQPEELATALTGYLEEEELTILTNTDILEVTKTDKKRSIRFTVNGEEKELEADQILVATGRQGNTGNLNLESAGIDTEGRGYIPVDETMRTNTPNIFAAGDVLGERQFVYTAAYEGKIAAENAMRGSHGKADFSVLPWVIFTDPQVAGVGMDEQQAEEAGVNYQATKLTLDNVPRSIAARDTRGYIKLIRDKDNDRLIGARILAPEGSELLMELVLAIRHGVTIQSLKSEFHPYLTLSEGIKLAALTFDKDVKKLSCCAV
jgi:mercuric reductase